jgi:hypothetical protein
MFKVYRDCPPTGLRYKLCTNMETIFLSHATFDSDAASAIKALIEHAFPNVVSVFVSGEDLHPGEIWRTAIREKLQRSSLFIALLSPSSLRRAWVIFEFGAAVGKNVDVIPVLIRGVAVSNLFSPLDEAQAISQLTSRHECKGLLDAVKRKYDWDYRANAKLNKLCDSIIQIVAPSPDDLPPPISPAARAIESALIGEMRGEILDLSVTRVDFWGAIDELYQRQFANQNGFPADVRVLCRNAEPPPNLPLSSGRNLYQWVPELSLSIEGAGAKLLDFCKSVYQPKSPTQSTNSECSDISDSLFEAFHAARGRHAHLFNLWARRVYESRTVSLEAIISEFKGYRDMIMLLAFLEPCLAQFTHAMGGGKEWLYKLNRDWDRALAQGA